jgi:translocation and assembly module TamB
MKRKLAIALLIIAVPVAAFVWLMWTEGGLRATGAMLARALDGKLQFEELSGRLVDHVQIGGLRWQNDTTTVEVKAIGLHWSPLALTRGELDIASLQIGETNIATRSSDDPPKVPETLSLPVRITIGQASIGPLHINDQLIFDQGSARLSTSSDIYALKQLSLRRGDTNVAASGTLGMHKPYALNLDSNLAGKVADKSFALALKVTGDLERSEIELHKTSGPFDLDAQAVLHPFQPFPLAAFSANAGNLDLALLMAELPQTQIDAACSMDEASDKGRVSGNCRIDNRLAGPLDRQRLPLARLSTRLDRDGKALQLSDLRIAIDRGTLQGKASWSGNDFSADLMAQALDFAAIHGKMRATRMSGPITLSADTSSRRLRMNLRESRLSVLAQISQHEAQIDLGCFELQASGAKLALTGNLNTNSREFSLRGTFERFDPAQFMRVPAGNLNGDLSINGRLANAPQLNADFVLRDSRLANAPATGRGKVNLAWPQVRRADVALDLGVNKLRLAGAFGRAGEQLTLDITAPALSPYGMDGDLQAHFVLSGTPSAPLLNGRADSASLRLPAYGRLKKLAFDTEMGAGPNAPMNVNMQLERLDLVARANAVRQLALNIAGTSQQHQLKLSARLGEDAPLNVAAQGGFIGTGFSSWQGRLTQLAIDHTNSDRYLHLERDAELAFASERWSIGPMQARSLNATIKLNASAKPGAAALSLSADNSSVGTASLELAAKPTDAWSLSAQTPWQGRLKAAIADLAWANNLLGAGWRAGGRLDVDVKIAGTPQYPLLTGYANGDNLSLHNLDTKLDLQQGILRTSLRDSVLHLDEFSAQSILTPMPTDLQRTMSDKGQALVATPGRVSARGDMRLGAPGAIDSDELQLHVTLDRMGVSQTPMQWLLLSGQAQLSWQQGKLGLDAKLGVDAAYWQLSDLSRPQLSADVVVHREGSASSEARRGTSWAGTMRIGMGRHFYFNGAGARGRLAGQVEITASAQDLARAAGTVNLVDGRYTAYGQQLDIERGILNFQGLLENPALNIRAVRRGLPVEAGVEITGFAQSPQIRLVSEPDVSDAAKLSWLVLGRPPEQEGTDAGVLLAAVSAIFGNQAGNAGQHLRQSFGLDEINVRTGTIGQQNAMRSSVVSMSDSSQSTGQIFAVGRQLSNRLRLSYEQAIGGADSLVKLTLKLSNSLSLVGTSGTDAALDVYYGFNFGGAPAKPKQQKTEP